jgi:leucyl/phenylalanyl-tRNA--protein transferase
VIDFPFEWIDESRPWMSPEYATPEGIVGVGGCLSSETLLNAYAAGIFPWFNEEDPVIWWSPDPRCIIEFESFHIPKRLAATIRKKPFEITINEAFEEVIFGCSERREEGTWLTDSMIEAYLELHEAGHAHSLECWAGDELAGGIYGVGVGGLFAGESMFYRRTDASKVALVHLVERLKERGYELFDLQILNEHTAQFGAVEIPRSDYLARVQKAVAKTGVRFE